MAPREPLTLRDPAHSQRRDTVNEKSLAQGEHTVRVE
jgi:hypothetical protein